jgi:hypothetical protein
MTFLLSLELKNSFCLALICSGNGWENWYSGNWNTNWDTNRIQNKMVLKLEYHGKVLPNIRDRFCYLFEVIVSPFRSFK